MTDHTADRMQARRQLLRQLRADMAAAPSTCSPVAAAAGVPVRKHWRIAATWLLAGQGLLLAAVAVHALRRDRGAPAAPALDAPAAAAPLAGPVTAPLNTSTPLAAAPAAAVLEATGLVTASRVATVSPRTTGLLVGTYVDEGAHVKRGDLLARLDDSQARIELALSQAQLTAADAALASSEATVREARRTLQREQGLFDQQFSSAARLSSAQAAVETAEANAGSARAARQVAALQVQRQQQALENYLVRAPFDGIVQARNAQTGEFVAPGSAGGGYTRTGVFTILDRASLEIVVDVNEQLIHRVQVGQRVRAELYAQRQRIDGHVLRVLPSADRAKATVRVRIALDTHDDQVLPDMAVKVAFL